jgi:hypothetical protein
MTSPPKRKIQQFTSIAPLYMLGRDINIYTYIGRIERGREIRGGRGCERRDTRRERQRELEKEREGDMEKESSYLLPLLFANNPPIIAPNGPPIAKADTAKDQSVVLWPGNTTAAGAFITAVLYPTRN